MSLNQGDYISTGAGSSVVLRVSDRQDEITLGENSDFYISDLANQGDGSTSKFKMWAGSMWVKVKSLVSSEDEFEVETPTAVMGVRGTHYYAGVSPITGETTAAVFGGFIRVSSVTATENEETKKSIQENKVVYLYPAQQINLDSRTEVPDLRLKVSLINPAEIVKQASPKVLEALIKDKPSIDLENSQFIDKQKQLLGQGTEFKDDNSILRLKSTEDLSKVEGNLNNFINAIAKQAIDEKKIQEQVITDTNKTIPDPNRKIDLERTGLDNSAGIDPEEQRLRDELLKSIQAQNNDPAAEEQRRLIEAQQNLASLLQQILQDRQKLEETNKAVEKQNNQKAAEKAQQQTGTPSNNGNGGGGSNSSGSSGGSNNKPNPPVVTSPTGPATVTNPVKVALTAKAGSTIRIYNNGTEIASGTGNGGTPTEILLGNLAPGTYNFTARAFSGSDGSSSVTIPAITVVSENTAPNAPTIVSPTQPVTVNNPVSVTVKAQSGATVIIYNNETEMGRGTGAGDTEVVISLGSLNPGTYNLTARAYIGSAASETVPIPAITVASGNTVSEPSLLFKPGTVQGSTANVILSLKDFTGSKQLYAIEAHLLYSDKLKYEGSGTVAKVSTNVFGLSQSAETLTEHTNTAKTETELIYAATNYELTGGAPSQNIEVKGEKQLVTIPLAIKSSDTAAIPVKLIYYKIVDKDGNVVKESKDPIEISVPVNNG
nr:FecR domain-containing protein [Paenibacillus hamazuiensis]